MEDQRRKSHLKWLAEGVNRAIAIHIILYRLRFMISPGAPMRTWYCLNKGMVKPDEMSKFMRQSIFKVMKILPSSPSIEKGMSLPFSSTSPSRICPKVTIPHTRAKSKGSQAQNIGSFTMTQSGHGRQQHLHFLHCSQSRLIRFLQAW